MTWQGYTLGQNIFLNLNFEPRKAVCEEIESRHGFFCSIIQTVFISRTLLLHPHLVAPLFTSPLPALSPASDWLPYLHLTWHLIFSLPRLSHDLIRQLSAQHCLTVRGLWKHPVPSPGWRLQQYWIERHFVANVINNMLGGGKTGHRGVHFPESFSLFILISYLLSSNKQGYAKNEIKMCLAFLTKHHTE